MGPGFESLREHYNALWCNGNTEDFGSLVQGSNPCKATIKYTRVTQLVRVPGLYPGGQGFKSLHEYSALLTNMCAPKTEIY